MAAQVANARSRAAATGPADCTHIMFCLGNRGRPQVRCPGKRLLVVRRGVPIGRGLAVSIAATAVLLFAVPTAAPAATYPLGFTERTIFTGLDQPDRRSLRIRRLRRREERGGQGLRPLSDTTPTVFADLGRMSTTSGTAGCWGWRSIPTSRRTVRLCPLYLRRFDRRHCSALGHRGCYRTAAHAAGRTSDGCVVAGGSRASQADGNTMIWTEDVLIHDWCQQFPSHSIGRPGFGA